MVAEEGGCITAVEMDSAQETTRIREQCLKQRLGKTELIL